MDSDVIKACVANYYRYKRQCPIVALEVWHYRYFNNQPDVLAIDKENRPIEIEVKVSLSDFKADQSKHIWAIRKRNENEWPWQFYYAVPDYLIEKVQPILPKGCGLMKVSSHWHGMQDIGQAVKCVVNAPTHKEGETVSDTYLQTLIAAQSATLCRALRDLEREKRTERRG